MKNSIVLFLCICYYCGYAQQWSGPNTTTSTIYRSAAVKVGYGPLYLDWTFENNWGGNANNWAGYIGFNAFRANNDTKDHYYGDNIYTSKAVFEGSSSGFRWLYRTTPAGSSDGGGQHLLAELMRISPTGNVGIGTTSPAGKLDVNKAGGQIRLSGGTVAGGIWTSTTDILYLADWNTGTKGLNINMSNGNVGIGTNSPDYKLTVNGKIKA